jgi:hypothetical protein
VMPVRLYLSYHQTEYQCLGDAAGHFRSRKMSVTSQLRRTFSSGVSDG